MINLEELLEEAKALGIKNPDALDVEALQVAIDNKKQELETKAKKSTATKTPAKSTAKPKAGTKAKAEADAKAKAEADAKAKAEADAKEKAKANAELKCWTAPNGDKWAFKKGAPEKLNWDGEIKTQDEILNDNAIMGKLTRGYYSFIKRV